MWFPPLFDGCNGSELLTSLPTASGLLSMRNSATLETDIVVYRSRPSAPAGVLPLLSTVNKVYGKASVPPQSQFLI